MSENTIMKLSHTDSIDVENIRFDIMTGSYSESIEPEQDMVLRTILHTHFYCETFICKQGGMQFLTKDFVVVLPSSGIVIVPPFCPHCCIQKGNSESVSMSFLITERPGNGHRDLYRLFKPFMEQNRIIVIDTIKIPFEELLTLQNNSKEGVNFSEILDLLKFLTSVAQSYENHNNNHKNSESHTKEQTASYRLDDIINCRFHENLTAESVAGQLFISTRQLSRMIQKNYHTNFHQILTQKRIAATEQLLLQTDIPISNITVLSGFGSSASFYRAFKKKNHCYPSQFRNQKGNHTPESGTEEMTHDQQ